MKKWIKRSFFSLLGISWLLGSGFQGIAAPADSEISEFQQPSGETFEAQLVGDEYLNYVLANGTGDLIELNEDGYWYYSILNEETKQTKSSDRKYLIDDRPNEGLTYKDVNELEQNQKEDTQKQLQSLTINKWNREQPLVVMLIEFNDTPLKYSDEDWEKRTFSQTGKSLYTYYKEATQDKIHVLPAQKKEGAQNGIVRIKLDREHPNNGNNFDLARPSLKEAMEKLGEYIDISSYDTNKNGLIELNELHVMAILAGYEASTTQIAPNIWGHKGSFQGRQIGYPIVDGIKLNNYTAFGEGMLNNKTKEEYQSELGLLAHEFGHDLLLPDLYNSAMIPIEIEINGETKIVSVSDGDGLGRYSLMAGGSWTALEGENAGATPVHLDAYSKVALGITEPTLITDSQTVTVGSINENNFNIYRMNTPNPKEYYLIENRQLTGFDSSLKTVSYSSEHKYKSIVASGGIAIYHINEKYSKNTSSAEQLVTLKEADEGILGYSKLNKPRYYGTNNYDGFYYKGFGGHSQEQQTIFSRTTLPSTAISDGSFPEYDLIINSEASPSMSVTFQKPVIPVESITIAPEEATLMVGDKIQFGATIYPENASDKEIKWSSTDDLIGSIDQEGKLIGKSKGTVIISAVNEKFNIKKEIQVTVNPKLGDTAEEAVEYSFEDLESKKVFDSKQFQGSGWIKIKVPESGYYATGGLFGFKAVSGYEGKGSVKAEFYQEHSLKRNAGVSDTAHINNGDIRSGGGSESRLPIYYEKDSYMYVKFTLSNPSGDCAYIFVLKKSDKNGDALLTADGDLSLTSTLGIIPNLSTYYILNREYTLKVANKIVPTATPQYKIVTSTPDVVTLSEENGVYSMEFKKYGTFNLTLIEQVSGVTREYTDEVRERKSSELGKTAEEAVEYSFEDLESKKAFDSKQFQGSGWIKIKVPESGYYATGGLFGFKAVSGYEGKGSVKAEFYQEHSLKRNAGVSDTAHINNGGIRSGGGSESRLPIYYEKDSYMYVKFTLSNPSGDCAYTFVLKKI